MSTMIGAQASSEQLEKIMSYMDIGRQEGAEVLIGGERNTLDGELSGGFYVKPTVFKGHNKMRVFQEEIFGPVVSVTTFKTDEEALEIANDTLYGLGSGVWSRDANRCYNFGRNIQAGRVWTNCYHAYPLAPPSAATSNPASAAKPQDDARPLSADQEHAGELQPESAGFLLMPLDLPLEGGGRSEAAGGGDQSACAEHAPTHYFSKERRWLPMKAPLWMTVCAAGSPTPPLRADPPPQGRVSA